MTANAWAAARATTARTSGDRNTTNRQHWAFAPDGAQVAASRQRSRTRSSTGSAANRRIDRAVDMTSQRSSLPLLMADPRRKAACACLFRETDGLDGEVLGVPVGAVTVAQPALLRSAERTGDPEVALAVDGDVASTHALSDGERPVDVSSADFTGQAVDAVVGDGDGLVVGVVRRDGQHRPEDLLLGDLGIGVDVGQQGGLRVVAVGQILGHPAAGHESGAGFDSARDQAEHLLPLRAADLRPLHDARYPRVP